MIQYFRPGLSAIVFSFFIFQGPTMVIGGEGMYPISMLPDLDLNARGIQLSAEDLFNPSQISLIDGICRVNGCTGSFVSDNGLIITNHHCAYGAIQQASTADNDLLANGFSAANRQQEIPAPDYLVRITEDYRDVSEAVLSAVNDEMSFLERTKAIEKRSKELELEAEAQNTGLRAEVAEMFAGRTYVLFLYTYLRDVRLVFAPPASVGNFGGEVDNWEWPRHTGDFSFMRAYTAPDGSSATYSADNVPFRPKRYIQVAANGVDEADAVFLLGYPGRTARHKTSGFLRYEKTVRLPTIVELYQWQIAEMEKAGAADRAVAIKHASRMRSLANVEKRSRGQMQGLHRANIIEKRQAQESDLQDFINADVDRRSKFGLLLKDIDHVYAEMAANGPLEIHVEQLRSACRAAAFGYFVYDAAVERAKPDVERESAYMDRNFRQSVEQVKTSVSDWHQATDTVMLAGMLKRLSEIPAVKSIPPLAERLGDPEDIDRIAEGLISATQLGQWQFVEQCLEKSPEELQQLKDPMLQLMIQLHPTYLMLRNADKQREGKLNQLYGSLIQVKQQFLSTDFVPDANGTLRFTSGRVRSYSPADAVIRTPISTLKGVIEKTTGVEPFVTPQPVIDRFNAADFGPFVHPGLGQIPVAILYDTDTTGGNSGSPVLNAAGQLVGVNFDRCFEATINDFAWDQSYSRSIGVDIRYVLWITGTVYQSQHLLTEMGIDITEQ